MGVLSRREGAVDLAELDVAVDDRGGGVVGLNVRGHTAAGRAGTARGPGVGRVNGVGRVEPQHVGVVVVPQAHDEDHAVGHGRGHGVEAALLRKVVGAVGGRLLGGAVVVGDGVARDARHVGRGVANGLAVLDVEALDLVEGAGVVSQELGHDREHLGGVDELGAAAVEPVFLCVSRLVCCLPLFFWWSQYVRRDGGDNGSNLRGVTHAVGVEVASVRVTSTTVAVGRVRSAAVVTSAHVLRDVGAAVGGQGRGDQVGLPDVHLDTAGAMVADTGVGVVGRGRPAVDVALAVDELEVTGALGVAVASAVRCTSLVARVLGHAAVGVHGNKVEGTVQTARQVGHVHVKGELLAQQVKGLVLGLGRHQEETAANVGIGALGDEAEGQSVVGRGHTVGGLVVGAINAAVGGTGRIIGAEVGVPGVSGVAVGVAGHIVGPAPVGIDGHIVGSVGTSRGGTGRPREGRLGLGGGSAGLLRAAGRGEEGRKKGSSLSHGEENECGWGGKKREEKNVMMLKTDLLMMDEGNIDVKTSSSCGLIYLPNDSTIFVTSINTTTSKF